MNRTWNVTQRFPALALFAFVLDIFFFFSNSFCLISISSLVGVALLTTFFAAFLAAGFVLVTLLTVAVTAKAHGSDRRDTRVTSARNNDAADSDGIEDDGIDDNGETSDHPSPTDLFLRSDSGFGGSVGLSSKASASPVSIDRIGEKRWHEGDYEDRASPMAMAAAGSRPGASQDNPIVLDDVEQVDIPHTATPDDKPFCLNVTDGPPPSDSSLALFEGTAEPRIEDGKENAGSLMKYNMSNPAGDEKEGGSDESPKANALRIHDLTRGNGNNECGDGDTGSDAPASVGRIHDVFAEFEETFGKAKQRQKMALATLHGCPDRDVTVGSIPRPAGQEEHRSTTDDGAPEMKQLAGAASANGGRHPLSKGEIENGTAFQLRQEMLTEDVSTLASGRRSGEFHIGVFDSLVAPGF
ncbi:hypothetical protein LTR72_011825 [Exophiala xenobiotica]|nr:hypothetical protein LTR72_011825 [Exophiala xenobiotica]KAK5284100.1 hypothetical protein LTR14_011767 [Exophiala xenobiotica]